MAHWFRRRAGALALVATLACSGCRGNETPPSGFTPANHSDSALAATEEDAPVPLDTPVFSEEAVAPILENPETEPTGNASIGHCEVRDSDNLCINFTGLAWKPDDARAECANAPGSSFKSENCPVESRIGTCVIHPDGDVAFEMVHSFYAPMDIVLAQAICPGRFDTER